MRWRFKEKAGFEIPYDDYYDENGVRIETEIIKVPFYIPYDEGWDIRFPKDWARDNSPFKVQDINAGAVAWVYDKWTKTSISAGCCPSDFLKKINKINEAREDERCKNYT